MWKLRDTITGIIYENKMRFRIIELGHELIDDYKRDNLKTYIQYLGNQEYVLKKYN